MCIRNKNLYSKKTKQHIPLQQCTQTVEEREVNQKSEVRSQKSEARSQKSEARSQKSEVKGEAFPALQNQVRKSYSFSVWRFYPVSISIFRKYIIPSPVSYTHLRAHE